MNRSKTDSQPRAFFLIRLLQGALIGLGAVLPGISGGVLCVVFGIYRPVMELLSSPFKRFRTHVPRLLPVIIGAAVGFLGIANLLSFFLEKYPDPSVCVFVGLIAGMLPSLMREAGQEGHSAGSWISMVIAFLVIMILPIIGALPSELRMMRLLGFYDNVFALMLMKGSYTGMNFMIFHATFASIEKDYTEAATIDGASHVAIMFKIIFPMAKQIITILALTSMITYWNDWNVSVTYLPSWPTASYALFVFQNSNLPEIALGGIPYIFCACTVVMLPLLVIFIVFREQLMGEISFGGVKG